MLRMENEFSINNKALHIYCLSDAHLGSNVFNREYWEYALKIFKKDKHNKVLYLNGDLLELASKNTGDSVFNQEMDVNEQINQMVEYLEPHKQYIRGLTSGNHDSMRTKKDFNLDTAKVIADMLDVPYNNIIYDTLLVNDKKLSIYLAHGKGSSKLQHLALGKIQRDMSFIEADINFMGHLHRCGSIEQVYYQPNKGYYRRLFCLTGHFLRYENSYANNMLLSPSPESFLRVEVDKDLNKNVTMYESDKINWRIQ